MVTSPSEVAPHLGLECAVEALNHGRLELGLDCEEANVFNIQQVLHHSVVKLSPVVRLQALRLASLSKHTSEGGGHLDTRLVYQRHCPCVPAKQVNEGEDVPVAIVY